MSIPEQPIRSWQLSLPFPLRSSSQNLVIVLTLFVGPLAISSACWAGQKIGDVLGAVSGTLLGFVGGIAVILTWLTIIGWASRRSPEPRLDLYDDRIVCGRHTLPLHDLEMDLGWWMTAADSRTARAEPAVARGITSGIALGVVMHLRSGADTIRIGGSDHALADGYLPTQPTVEGFQAIDGYLADELFRELVDTLWAIRERNAPHRTSQNATTAPPLWTPSTAAGSAFDLRSQVLEVYGDTITLRDRTSGTVIAQAPRHRMAITRRTTQLVKNPNTALGKFVDVSEHEGYNPDYPVLELRFPNGYALSIGVHDDRFGWRPKTPDWYGAYVIFGVPDWRRLLAALAIDQTWR